MVIESLIVHLICLLCMKNQSHPVACLCTHSLCDQSFSVPDIINCGDEFETLISCENSGSFTARISALPSLLRLEPPPPASVWCLVMIPHYRGFEQLQRFRPFFADIDEVDQWCLRESQGCALAREKHTADSGGVLRMDREPCPGVAIGRCPRPRESPRGPGRRPRRRR